MPFCDLRPAICDLRSGFTFFLFSSHVLLSEFTPAHWQSSADCPSFGVANPPTTCGKSNEWILIYGYPLCMAGHGPSAPTQRPHAAVVWHSQIPIEQMVQYEPSPLILHHTTWWEKVIDLSLRYLQCGGQHVTNSLKMDVRMSGSAPTLPLRTFPQWMAVPNGALTSLDLYSMDLYSMICNICKIRTDRFSWPDHDALQIQVGDLSSEANQYNQSTCGALLG